MRLYSKQFFKGLMNALSITAIFIFSFLPAILPFFSNTTHHSGYKQSKGYQKGQNAHFSHGMHDVSWNIIRNHQLSSPPLPLKVKPMAMVNLLLAFFFVSFLCAFTRVYAKKLKPAPIAAVPKYLANRILLI